jgi:3-hydroxyisobutyrate dehydrogenase-like beta-hydroxyacid dehydrogenase
MTTDKIGFIGLGEMGEPMAGRLLQHGYDVISCANRRREAIESLATEGLREQPNPRAVGAQSDILMTIVIDDKQTDQVLRGPDGALDAMKPGAIIIIMSTLSPDYCKQISEEAKAKDITVMDCPVSGGTMGAKEGTLSLLIGGDADAIERCRAPLEAMGVVIHCGDVGLGQVVKLANNAIACATMGILKEVRDLVRAHDVDVEEFMAILNRSTGRSFVSEHVDLFKPPLWGHMINLGLKDSGLCLDVADQAGVKMPLLQLFQNQDWEATKETFI